MLEAGKTYGKIKVIRREFNPDVQYCPNKYHLVEFKGSHRLMREDNILNHEKRISKKETVKDTLKRIVNSGDNNELAAFLLIIAREIQDIYENTARDKFFYTNVTKNIENYLGEKLKHS